MSRALGAVGEAVKPLGLARRSSTRASFLAGALPKLFGLFSLLDLLETDRLLDAAPAFVSDALDAVTKLVTEAQRLKAALDEARRGSVRRSPTRAHAGAKAVAQRAKDQLDAVIGPLEDLTSTPASTPSQACPATPTTRSRCATPRWSWSTTSTGCSRRSACRASRPRCASASRNRSRSLKHAHRRGQRPSKASPSLPEEARRGRSHRADVVAARQALGPAGRAEHLQAEARTPCASTSRFGRRRLRHRRSTSSRRSSTSTCNSSATATPG